jgi:site-specific DNA recombinase
VTEPQPLSDLAGIYVRISRDLAGEGLGVARQEQDCRDLADKLGWHVVDVYIDNDISASTGKPRPAYRRLLADLDAGRIGAIIAWHPDRLYRRAVDLGGLVDACKRTNARVATVNAGEVDLTSPTGLLVADMLAAIAMYEVRHKSERWSRSWRQQRELGVPARTGSRMYGYTRDGKLIETEAAVARQMAADIIAGVPILAVSRRLEAEGIKTTRGSVWRTGTIRQYLANPRIAGLSTMGGEVVAEGQWDPILDRDTWETVRALLNARARGPVPRTSVLNGLLFCGTCGHRMITSGTRGRRTYRCPNRPGMPGCGGVSGYAEPIEEVVEAYAKARLDDPRVEQAITRLAAADAPEALTEIFNLEARITELEGQLEQPGVPVATILRAIDRSRERLEKAQQRLIANTPISPPAPGGEWPADLERRRRLIDLVVERVELLAATQRIKAFDPARVEIVGR